jgi:hypothetical protein
VTPTASNLHHARLLWDYLRLGVPARPAECLLVLGGHDIGVASRTAELYGQGMAPFIVVSGGPRAVPDGSDFLTEADAIAHAHPRQHPRHRPHAASGRLQQPRDRQDRRLAIAPRLNPGGGADHGDAAPRACCRLVRLAQSPRQLRASTGSSRGLPE